MACCEVRPLCSAGPERESRPFTHRGRGIHEVEGGRNPIIPVHVEVVAEPYRGFLGKTVLVHRAESEIRDSFQGSICPV